MDWGIGAWIRLYPDRPPAHEWLRPHILEAGAESTASHESCQTSDVTTLGTCTIASKFGNSQSQAALASTVRASTTMSLARAGRLELIARSAG
jgi:hypothetical protein